MSEKIKKFWELHKLSQTQDKTTKVKTQAEIIIIAKEIINSGTLKPTDKFFNFISKFAQATPIKNKDGGLLFIRFPKQDDENPTTFTKQTSTTPKTYTTSKTYVSKPKPNNYQIPPRKPRIEDTSKFLLTPNTNVSEEDVKLIEKFKSKPFKI